MHIEMLKRAIASFEQETNFAQTWPLWTASIAVLLILGCLLLEKHMLPDAAMGGRSTNNLTDEEVDEMFDDLMREQF